MLKHNRQEICLLFVIVGLLPAIAIGQEDVAPVVRKEIEEDLVVSETPLAESDRDHWAFRAVTRPPLPAVPNVDWPQNGLDRFILSRLEVANLPPTAEADRATLLRRLSFDLIGLPPTTDGLVDFEADAAPDGYERQIDRLLASPGYGERWGQHWLDLARFAETDGFEHDKVRADAWKYRDWVISALNENMPYDRFVQLQIAGDELDGGTQAVATMFCLSGPDMPDINDQFERRHLMLNEMTSTVGAVFLGLQLGCAECHDHKYDPISQADFYRLRAVFESAVPTLKRDAPYSQLKQQREVIPARFWIRGDHRRPGPKIEAAFPRIASEKAIGDAPNELSPRAAFAQWLTRADNPLTARVIVNRLWKGHFGRGLFETPSDVGLLNAEPSHPQLLDWLASEFQSQGWDLKWLHRQIVTSATYRQASRKPVGDSDWERRLKLDPNNVLYSRGTRRRLDAESIRDAMLQVAGQLTDERGGPGVLPPLPPELVETLLKGQWVTSPRATDHDRRSIYLFARRNLRYPLFEVFDRPDANASCGVRNRSTTPTQSLLLLNSELALKAARHLAGEILRESTDTEPPIDRLFRRAFARRPTSVEIDRVRSFILDEHDALLKEKRSVDRLALPYELDRRVDQYTAAAWVEVCLAVLNASEMLYVD